MSDDLVSRLRGLVSDYTVVGEEARCCSEAADEIERLRADAYDPAFSCTWIYDEDGPWETGCGHTWEFIDGDVAENGVKYCPFCGGRIQEPKAAGEE